MKEETKGLYLAILLSTIAILAVNWIWPSSPAKKTDEAPVVENKLEEKIPSTGDEDLYSPSDRGFTTVENALKEDRRITVKNDKLSGSLRVKGGRFDNLNLLKYKQTLDENSPLVELLQPSGTEQPYYAEFGWLSNSSLKLFKGSD